MLICNVVGARPNFMKIAPIVHELRRRHLSQMLLHTGQHYDSNMSQVFFDELGMPQPDIYLGVGSDTHARQTASVMVALEDILLEHQPGLMIVSGDVNSTLATALVAAKLGIAVAHVEAGLRSFDRTMPEEINRVVADHLADLLFTTEDSGSQNLQAEGIASNKIHFVGNCMVDTLLAHVQRALERAPWQDLGYAPEQYALLTVHRPSNVDDRATLTALVAVLNKVSGQVPILFPVHPRTRARLSEWDIALAPTIRMTEPLPYLTFLGLMAKARMVLTDSGGIQEETTALGVPCLTLRWNTERPITTRLGTNRLVGTDPEAIHWGVESILAEENGFGRSGERPPLWDGQAAVRLVDVVAGWMQARGVL